jgi:hypothetical protein
MQGGYWFLQPYHVGGNVDAEQRSANCEEVVEKLEHSGAGIPIRIGSCEFIFSLMRLTMSANRYNHLSSKAFEADQAQRREIVLDRLCRGGAQR